MNSYFVYILTNRARGTLYIGVTNNLERRLAEHRSGEAEGFTKRYALHELVYFEESSSAEDAIAREKQLKRWHRQWKINLIEESMNPDWKDLSPRSRMDAETSSA
ncbi:MAG TPA: GIY-YIG nuclease family protein [Candidatus Saccharimonadales bacterium]|nr:GIY-YIG nuclease family protein [Candidatus Saccharimonadales bacterium]